MRRGHSSRGPARIVVVEDGYRGLDKLPKPPGKFRDSPGARAHVYPTLPKEGAPELHEAFFREKSALFEREMKRLDAPLYVGEFDRRGWSWAVWIYKPASRDPVHGYWGFYRNAKPIDRPNPATDDADQLVAKMRLLRTESMEIYEPMQRALSKQ